MKFLMPDRILFVARRSRRHEVGDSFGVEPEHVCQDLIRMLAQKRRPSTFTSLSESFTV